MSKYASSSDGGPEKFWQNYVSPDLLSPFFGTLAVECGGYRLGFVSDDEKDLLVVKVWMEKAWVGKTEVEKSAAFYCCTFLVGIFWIVFWGPRVSLETMLGQG